MMMDARDELVAWLNGYVRGVTSINGMSAGHPTFSGSAFLIANVGEDIDTALSKYFEKACTNLLTDFPDLDVAKYQFEPAEVHENYLRWLHIELEQRLLPAPFATTGDAATTVLLDTRHNVAWHAMETIRLLSDDFQAPQIYRAKFSRLDRYNGYVYVIPLKNAHLALSFQECRQSD